MALTDNTQKINQLLDAINNLPEAGAGSSEPVLEFLEVTATEEVQLFQPDGFDGYYAVGVNPISKTYVGSNVPRKSAEQIRPGTTSREIASGTYLTGKQTILGDANLKAENIKKDVTIFDILGTYEGEGGSGGGLPTGISKISYGTITPSSDATTQINVQHSLGVKPDFVLWWLDDAFSEAVKTGGASRGSVLYTGLSESYNMRYIVAGYNTSGGVAGHDSGSMDSTYYMTATNVNIRCTSKYPFKAGFTYHWVIGTLDLSL